VAAFSAFASPPSRAAASSISATSGATMRALPKKTIVASTPCSSWTSSGLSSSSCRRIGRSSSRSRKSTSVKARR